MTGTRAMKTGEECLIVLQSSDACIYIFTPLQLTSVPVTIIHWLPACECFLEHRHPIDVPEDIRLDSYLAYAEFLLISRDKLAQDLGWESVGTHVLRRTCVTARGATLLRSPT